MMDLGSLRAAVLDEAEADVARRRAAVEVEAEHRLAAARAEAGALVEQGRLEGRLAGERESARRRGAASRSAREARLGARGSLYDELRSRAAAEALALRSEPGYRDLLDRLVATARAQLGAGAQLEIDPPGVGGVRARSGSRSVDYSLPVLVDRVLADLDGEVEKLWR
jgi:vacuolar-type H+-ATPase subunit E/Vma4